MSLRSVRAVLVARRCVSYLATPHILSPSLSRPTAMASQLRRFSLASPRYSTGANHALASAIQEELKYETEAAQSLPQKPEFLKAFQQQGVWQITEVHGQDDVVLTRKYGNEKIRLEFSIADLMNTPEESEFDDYDEGSEEGQKNEESSDPYIPTLPIRVSIVITKAGSPSALAVEAALQDGVFMIEGASYFKDASLAVDSAVDADWKRRNLYLGPQYDRLEVTLQEKFDEFLKERGIGDELASFIPDYAEWKEQKEYVDWLKNVKDFVDI